MKGYADLRMFAEDDRIKLIGQTCMAGNTVGVCLEKNEPAKIARYIRKITEGFPGVGVLMRIDGPTPSVVTIKFGKLDS